MMCEFLSRMLQPQFDVTAISNPRAALAQLLDGASYDLIVCDLMMPELTGMDLHDELCRAHSDQAERMIFMTGGTFTEDALEFIERVDRPLLTKPFQSDTLRSEITKQLRQLKAARSYH